MPPTQPPGGAVLKLVGHTIWNGFKSIAMELYTNVHEHKQTDRQDFWTPHSQFLLGNSRSGFVVWLLFAPWRFDDKLQTIRFWHPSPSGLLWREWSQRINYLASSLPSIQISRNLQQLLFFFPSYACFFLLPSWMIFIAEHWRTCSFLTTTRNGQVSVVRS